MNIFGYKIIKIIRDPNFGTFVTVKCHETLNSTNLRLTNILFFGCSGKSSISLKKVEKIDISFDYVLHHSFQNQKSHQDIEKSHIFDRRDSLLNNEILG